LTEPRDEAGDEPRPGLPHFLEVVVSAGGLVVALPLLIVAAIAIRLTSTGPAFFRQERVGRCGRPFLLLKLRTMRVGDGPQVTASGDPRITAVGRLLRRTKIDEVPQLWNVLRGDMSLVGPRPEVARYVDVRDPRWSRVLSVRPGLSDPASIRYRDEETILANAPGDRDRYYREVLLPAKLEISQTYLSQRTWRSDVAVVARTLGRLAGLTDDEG
jgi:lipopolysaccharide/colanic/teichoic acid biosynthesis glycosyltransferase